MKTLIIITVFVSTVYAAPQPQDESDPEFKRPPLAKLAGLMPKFLKEVSDDARKEFWQILKNNSNTIAETQSQLQAWAAKQGDEVQKDFENASEKLKEKIEALSEAISQSSLSEETKDAFNRLCEIASNEDQTIDEEIHNIMDYVQSLPVETRQEMRNFTANAIKSAINNDN